MFLMAVFQPVYYVDGFFFHMDVFVLMKFRLNIQVPGTVRFVDCPYLMVSLKAGFLVF